MMTSAYDSIDICEFGFEDLPNPGRSIAMHQYLDLSSLIFFFQAGR